MSLAEAPAGLRAAVRIRLGATDAPGASTFQRAKLTASNGATNDYFAYSVAISGQTAVVGAYNKNSGRGAAYVFVRSGAGWSQQAELRDPAPAAANDSFGVSVAIYGQTAVIGAPDKNSGKGAAYVFLRSGTGWSQQKKLTASDAAAFAQFGASVAIYRSTAVIGAPDKNSNTGAAYVFVRSGTAWSQQKELTASDAAAKDQFGSSVAISGQTAVVGANGQNSFTGAAYVFVRSGTAWSQQKELTASDAATGDSFGASVAISGSTAVIGALGKNSFTGAAYVFMRSGASWSQQQELTAFDGAKNDYFGVSVAISGSTVLVGAYTHNSRAGAAYMFVRSGSAWPLRAELTALDGAANDLFGFSVAIDGSTAVIGAFGKNSITGAAYVFALPSQQAKLTAADATAGEDFGVSVAVYGSTAVVGAPLKNSGTGAAYVFVRSGTAWSQQKKLTASNGAPNDHFGSSVAIYRSTVVVGAYNANSGKGAAYVFVRSGTAWSQQKKLTAGNGAAGDFFGFSVAISAQTAVIGAYNKNSGEGAAYVFVRSGTAWSQQKELTASDAAAGDQFGSSVAISGQTAVVGAYGKNSNTGAAYVFVRSGTVWSQQKELTASDAAAGDLFGLSVALSGSTALIGAHGKNSNTGAAYVFVRSGTAWSQQKKLTASDGAADDFFGGSVALDGQTAVIGAIGGNSGGGAAYVFARSGTAWSQQAELTASDAAHDDSFGGSVALSGKTAIIGAHNKNAGAGAAYAFGNV